MSSTTKSVVATTMSRTYDASAPMAAKPSRATSGSDSANTPNGARTSTQRTRRSIASAMPRKNPTTGSRCSGAIASNAIPNTTANTTSGNIAPSAAARTGFGGTRSTSHCNAAGARREASAPAGVTNALPARACNVAIDAESIVTWAKTGGAMSAPTRPERQRNPNATSSARPPTRAIRVASAPAMPTMTSDTTSGITVIRIALTNSDPNGSMYGRTPSIVAVSVRLSRRPHANPAMSASRTLVLSDGRGTRQSYVRYGRSSKECERGRPLCGRPLLFTVRAMRRYLLLPLEPEEPLDPLWPLWLLDPRWLPLDPDELPLEPLMPPDEPLDPLEPLMPPDFDEPDEPLRPELDELPDELLPLLPLD